MTRGGANGELNGHPPRDDLKGPLKKKGDGRGLARSIPTFQSIQQNQLELFLVKKAQTRDFSEHVPQLQPAERPKKTPPLKRGMEGVGAYEKER